MRQEKGNALLVELVIVILFFALSQVIVLQAFVKAQQLNHAAEVTSLALLSAEDTAETLAASNDAESTLRSLGYHAVEGQYQTDSKDGYRITADISHFTQPTGVITTVELSAYRDAAKLFTLPAVRYQEANTP